MGNSISFAEILTYFLGGIISFISPCVFPIIPSYIAYITGISFEDLTDESKAKQIRKKTILHSIMFVLGFSIIFITLGATATLIGSFLTRHMAIIMKGAGVIIIIFGLHLAGIIQIPFLMAEHRVEMKEKPVGYLGSFLMGLAFGAGWTPCIGPLLGTALVYASSKDTVWAGVIMLSAYSLGLGIPFILVSLTFNSFLNYSAKFRKYLRHITVFSGVLLILVGITMIMNWFSLISGWFTQFFPAH